MPKIDILEKDETLAGESASSTDVVFVPGFANTNKNYYIITTSGKTPMHDDQGLALEGTSAMDSSGKAIFANRTNINVCEDEVKPQYACNTVDEITWFYDGSEWKTSDSGKDQPYIKPYPENTPVLCSTLREFEENFGTEPYQFTEEQSVAGMFEERALCASSAKLYKVDDYEKSYIYAKELIRAGLPVIYENIVDRTQTDEHNYFEYTATPAPVDGGTLYFTLHDNAVMVRKFIEAKVKEVAPAEFTNIVFTATVTTDAETGRDVVEWSDKSVTPEKAYDLNKVFGTDCIEGSVNSGDTITLTKDSEVFKHKCQKALPSVAYLYDNLVDCYTNSEKLLDKGELTVKFITSGAYPTFELNEEYGITNAMLTCASTRGDAVAIIDACNNPERPLSGEGSVYSVITDLENYQKYIGSSDDTNAFGTMFGPAWCTFKCVSAPKKHQTQLLPPSFGYLITLAQAIITNANWLAMAGVNRGLIPTVVAMNSIQRMSNTLADAYQPRDARALNAFTNIKPYGISIWGNRTLVDNAEGNLTATSFLNVRNLVSDIKKVAYTAAKSLLFEQNTEIMWNKFKAKLTPTLDKMVHGYGLSNYKLIKATTHYNGDPLAKGEVAAVIKIYPIYAVEDFEITVVMSDEGVDVE